jgi:hypothetical protein
MHEWVQNLVAFVPFLPFTSFYIKIICNGVWTLWKYTILGYYSYELSRANMLHER